MSAYEIRLRDENTGSYLPMLFAQGAEQHQMDAYCLRMGGGFSVSLNGCAVYSIGQGW